MMFMILTIMNITDMLSVEGIEMSTATGAAPALAHKHYRLDQEKIRRAQELLGSRTETETIEMALAEAIVNRETNLRLWAAHERFVNSGIVIEDVFE